MTFINWVLVDCCANCMISYLDRILDNGVLLEIISVIDIIVFFTQNNTFNENEISIEMAKGSAHVVKI